jgi:hypothetical protein
VTGTRANQATERFISHASMRAEADKPNEWEQPPTSSGVPLSFWIALGVLGIEAPRHFIWNDHPGMTSVELVQNQNFPR